MAGLRSGRLNLFYFLACFYESIKFVDSILGRRKRHERGYIGCEGSGSQSYAHAEQNRDVAETTEKKTGWGIKDVSKEERRRVRVIDLKKNVGKKGGFDIAFFLLGFSMRNH